MGQRLATRVRILLLQSLLHQVGRSPAAPGRPAPLLQTLYSDMRRSDLLSLCLPCLRRLPAPQDIPFFDRHENSTAAMLSTLSSDAAAVRGMVGDRLGHLATVAACVLGSYAVALTSRCAAASQAFPVVHRPRLHAPPEPHPQVRPASAGRCVLGTRRWQHMLSLSPSPR